MTIRCRLGWHDDRYAGTDRNPSPGILRVHHYRCQRCHRETTWTIADRPSKRTYVPPEGLPVKWSLPDGQPARPTIPPGEDPPEWLLLCVRPGTREHGQMRDGSQPIRSACEHAYKDHGEVRYFGNDTYRFVVGPCRDCSCEGFLG